MANIELKTDSDTVDVQTVTRLVKNDIEYKAKFTSEGLDIPVVITKNSNDSDPYMIVYQRIPKDVIIQMLKEYLPEVQPNTTIYPYPKDLQIR